MSKPAPGFSIDLEQHVLPVLHLARLAVLLEGTLRDVDERRKISPALNESLNNLGLMTDIGQTIASDADMAILSAIHMIEAYDRAQRMGGAA
jgi:hypothetical protein